MSKQSERAKFLSAMFAEFGETPAVERVATLIMRHAVTHGRLAEMECNGAPEMANPHIPPERVNKIQARFDAYVEKRTAQIERRIAALAKSIGATVTLGGDPRGFTVKIQMPKTGKYNTWGGAEDGYGVPQ